MDDGVDDRVDREMFGRRQRGEALGMPQQHVQELVADHGLHMRFGAAVLADERQVHEQARPLLAGDGQRRHGVGELHTEHLQHRADGERVLVDQFPVHVVKFSGGHA